MLREFVVTVVPYILFFVARFSVAVAVADPTRPSSLSHADRQYIHTQGHFGGLSGPDAVGFACDRGANRKQARRRLPRKSPFICGECSQKFPLEGSDGA